MANLLLYIFNVQTGKRWQRCNVTKTDTTCIRISFLCVGKTVPTKFTTIRLLLLS